MLDDPWKEFEADRAKMLDGLWKDFPLPAFDLMRHPEGTP